MRNLFEVNKDEKNRILELHESATKKQYLSENPITNPITTSTQTVDPVSAAKMESFDTFRKLKKDEIGLYVYRYLYRVNREISPEEVRTFLKDPQNSKIYEYVGDIGSQERQYGNAETAINSVGSYLKKHEDLMKKFYDFLKSKDVRLGMTVN